MKNILILYYIFILIFISSCNRRQQNLQSVKYKVSTIKIPEELSSELPLKSIASGIKYVLLETKGNNLISTPEKILFKENRIFLSDSKVNSLLVFNSNGKFLFQKNNIGKGPEDHMVISDFFVDTINHVVELIDPGNIRLIKMDLNGKFISNHKYPFSSNSFAKFRSGNYLFYSSYAIDINKPYYKIGIFDKNFNLLHNLFPIENSSNINASIPNALTEFKDGFNLNVFFCDTVYYVNEYELKAKYYIDFGKFKIKEEDRNSINLAYKKGKGNSKMLNDLTLNHASAVCKFFESEGVCNFQFQRFRIIYKAFYCKSTTMLKCANNIINDIDNGLFGTPVGISEQDELVTLIYPYDLLDHLEEMKKNTKTEKWEILKKGKMKNLLSIAAKLKNMDNPVLMFIKLKDF